MNKGPIFECFGRLTRVIKLMAYKAYTVKAIHSSVDNLFQKIRSTISGATINSIYKPFKWNVFTTFDAILVNRTDNDHK
jgi:hypothetical protein